MLEKEIKQKLEELKILKKKKSTTDKLRKLKTIVCQGNFYDKGCGSRLKIQDLTYIQTHWYERPWGCTGGDNWFEGEANFICPKCGARNRPCHFPDWSLIKDDKFSLIKNRFKDFKDEYDRN